MMPSGETLWSFRTLWPDVLARGRSNTVVGSLQYSGTSPTVSSASFALYRPDGIEVTGCTLVLASNVATVTIPSNSLPTTLQLGEGYREVWTFTIGGIPYQYERPAALALIQLAPPAITSDLTGNTGRLPALGRALGSISIQVPMNQAWEKIVRELIKAGHLPYLIRTPDALRECYILLSLARGCEMCAVGSDAAHWAAASVRYEKAFDVEWKQINWQTDYNHDGRVDDPQQRQSSRGGVLNTWGSVGARQLRGC